MVELAARAGVLRIVLNGSFVTDIIEPNDVDCALLIGPGYPKDAEAAEALDDGLPFLELNVVHGAPFNSVVAFFETDRKGNAKGMVELIQWS